MIKLTNKIENNKTVVENLIEICKNYSFCISKSSSILRKLTDEGAIVLLPVGSDVFIKHIADEVIYIDRKYDIEGLKKTYKTYFKSSNNSWIH